VHPPDFARGEAGASTDVRHGCIPMRTRRGYFRFSLAPADLQNLLKRGFAQLTTREKMALASSLRAGFARGTTPAADVLRALSGFASDPHPLVAQEPMGMVWTARDWLYGSPVQARVEAYARALFSRRAATFKWDPPKDSSSPETEVLRISHPWVLGPYRARLRQFAGRLRNAGVPTWDSGRMASYIPKPSILT